MSSCFHSRATGLHRPLAKLSWHQQKSEMDMLLLPARRHSRLLFAKRKDLFAACTQTVLNAQWGGKFSTFLDPANSLIWCQGGHCAQEGAFAMSSSLKFPSVSADTGRSDVVRNAPGSWPPNRALGRKVPKYVFISLWEQEVASLREQEVALDDTKSASASRGTSMCSFSAPQSHKTFTIKPALI